MNQHQSTNINPFWILLDSESTENIFCNKRFLTNLQSTMNGDVLRLESNGGYLESNQKGDRWDIIMVNKL